MPVVIWSSYLNTTSADLIQQACNLIGYSKPCRSLTAFNQIIITTVWMVGRCLFQAIDTKESWRESCPCYLGRESLRFYDKLWIAWDCGCWYLWQSFLALVLGDSTFLSCFPLAITLRETPTFQSTVGSQACLSIGAVSEKRCLFTFFTALVDKVFVDQRYVNERKDDYCKSIRKHTFC